MIVVKAKIDHGNCQYNEFHLVDLPEEVEKLEKNTIKKEKSTCTPMKSSSMNWSNWT